ncbi:MAG: GHMP kinase [Saprospiraceae bacterium]|nr:GHMP kinase [Saprospiraceae bacterium]
MVFYGHGKLLLTSEYAVLDGALALAIPTRYGQKMSIKKTRKSDLYWKSYDHAKEEWFSAQISLYDFSAVKTSDEEKALQLKKLLKGAVRLNSEFLSKWNGFDVKTELEFDRTWGLGSSSSLTFLVAQWADINPLLLHFEISNGSGYDVACAGADFPISYQLGDEEVNYSEIEFDPSFKDHLYFVHLNEKQSSSSAVEFYFKKAKNRKTLVKKLSKITEDVLACKSFNKFCDLIDEHENLVSEHLSLPKIKELHFSDFEGSMKSLGAWGGDFIMAASDLGKESVNAYFSSKGFQTIIPYEEMIFKAHELSPA